MKTVKLGDVLEKTSTIKWKEQPSSRVYSYVDLTSVDRGKHEITQTSDINAKNAPSRAQKIIKTNDIIFGTTRPTLNRLCIVPEEYDEQICSTGFCVLRANTELVTPSFIYYLLTTKGFIEYVEATQRGTSYPAVTDKDIKQFEFALPSLEEQRRIVARLDAAFEKIDRAIKLTGRNLIHAKSLYTSARSGTIKKLAGSESKLINDIGKNLDSMRVPITKNKRKSGPYPYYGASGVVDHVDNYIFDQEALLISEDGANLLARSTPIAFVASGKYWVNNHAHIYEFADQVTLKYVEYYLENIDLKPFITGAAQPKLSQGNLNKIPIFIPSVEIQKEIVTIISKAQESAHQLAGQYRVKINHLKALKQSMLTQAFSEGGVQ